MDAGADPGSTSGQHCPSSHARVQLSRSTYLRIYVGDSGEQELRRSIRERGGGEQDGGKGREEDRETGREGREEERGWERRGERGREVRRERERDTGEGRRERGREGDGGDG